MIIRPKQIVNYVAPAPKEGAKNIIRKALVIEPIGQNAAQLDLGNDEAKSEKERYDGKHIAEAHFNEDKATANTFHVVEEEEAPAAKPAAKAPAAPAA